MTPKSSHASRTYGCGDNRAVTIFLQGHHEYPYGMTSGHMPWDILSTNIEEQTDFGVPYDALIIGGGQFDDIDHVYSQRRDGTILAFDLNDSKTVIFEWENFETFLKLEIARLDSIVDDSGLVVRPEVWSDHSFQVEA